MQINQEILQYVNQNILPKYNEYDKAHNSDHINKVIQNSLEIAVDYDVDPNKVYVIAAYHDIGILHGRKDHEKKSAEYVLADTNLKKWFSNDEINLMAEAVCDHRASNDYEPRSIYGKIVSEADRDLAYETVITRTILYSFKLFPQYTKEQHFKRTLDHIKEKYAENGYLKLWLNTEKNQKYLQEIRQMINTPEKIRADFNKIYETEFKQK